MEIDTEPAADRALLSGLVQREVDKRTNKLQSEVQRLRSLLPDAKNKSRGPSTSATKKKKDASNKPSGKTDRGRTKAAAAPNDTGSGK